LADPKKRIKGGPALMRFLGHKGSAILERINEWLGRDRDFLRTMDGLIIRDSQENIRRALRLLDLSFSYNTYADQMCLQSPSSPLSSFDDTQSDRLWLQVDSEFHFRPTRQFFDTVVRDLSHEQEFHPVCDYLNALTWDGVPRIDRWLEYYGGGEDSPYHRAISAIVLIAAVRRARHPGCKFDEMLVLESTQGWNKSTMLRTLCPQDEWFTDDLPLNVDAKQIIERTLGKWIIEASDLVGGRRADRDHLKSMLSRQIDGPVRLAYARISISRARHFIIIGTTNAKNYLADPTGARRFWPVKVEIFDLVALSRDRDQLWAEAAQREAKGESIRLHESLWIDAATHQDLRQETDAWEEVLAEGVKLMDPSNDGKQRVTTANLWELLHVDISRRDRSGAMRISEIMQKLGFERTKIYSNEKTQAGYISLTKQLF